MENLSFYKSDKEYQRKDIQANITTITTFYWVVSKCDLHVSFLQPNEWLALRTTVVDFKDPVLDEDSSLSNSEGKQTDLIAASIDPQS